MDLSFLVRRILIYVRCKILDVIYEYYGVPDCKRIGGAR